eukprot:4663238-Alexandrium_andersonii.AAC.1
MPHRCALECAPEHEPNVPNHVLHECALSTRAPRCEACATRCLSEPGHGCCKGDAWSAWQGPLVLPAT